MSTSFVLHAQLAADTQLICELPACRLLLMNDARFPWCILVPKVNDARELHALPEPTRTVVLNEVLTVAAGLEAHTGALKMNVAALGNMVPQLHIHVIARHPGDAAWPAPVWGSGLALPYANDALQAQLQALRQRFSTGPPRSA